MAFLSPFTMYFIGWEKYSVLPSDPFFCSLLFFNISINFSRSSTIVLFSFSFTLGVGYNHIECFFFYLDDRAAYFSVSNSLLWRRVLILALKFYPQLPTSKLSSKC